MHARRVCLDLEPQPCMRPPKHPMRPPEHPMRPSTRIMRPFIHVLCAPCACCVVCGRILTAHVGGTCGWHTWVVPWWVGGWSACCVVTRGPIEASAVFPTSEDSSRSRCWRTSPVTYTQSLSLPFQAPFSTAFAPAMILVARVATCLRANMHLCFAMGLCSFEYRPRCWTPPSATLTVSLCGTPREPDRILTCCLAIVVRVGPPTGCGCQRHRHCRSAEVAQSVSCTRNVSLVCSGLCLSVNQFAS
jgi:hypothetical protein